MKINDIIALLEGFGFRDLAPQKIEDKTFTFKFGDHDYRGMVKTFGQPSVAGGGKVAVFEIPGYGRLGVSPSNRMVRLAYKGNHAAGVRTDDGHLAKLETTPALNLLFAKAQANKAARIRYIEQAMAFFNRTKFHGKLPVLKVQCSAVPPKLRGINNHTRAFFAPRGASSYFWFQIDLFNASEHFVNEIIVHEQCHQAVYVDLGHTELEEQGHGPKWQAWMRKVGLDPRRFDPTDNLTYKDTVTQNLEEEDRTIKYGPQTPAAFFKKLTPATEPPRDFSEEFVFSYLGRAFVGKFKKKGAKYEFTGVGPNRKTIALLMTTWRPTQTWKSK